MDSEAKPVRADIYHFIHEVLGVSMTKEQKHTLKGLLIANANAQAEDLLSEITTLKTKLAHRK